MDIEATIEKLKPEDGDVLFLIGAENPNETGLIIRNMLRRLFDLTGNGGQVAVIALPPGMSVEKLSVQQMADLGFIQDTRRVGQCPHCGHGYRYGPPAAVLEPQTCIGCLGALHPPRPAPPNGQPKPQIDRRQRLGE